MWLLKKVAPDYQTMADLRKDNLAARRAVGREFTLLCNELEVCGGDLVAIDGSTFQAVTSRTRNCTATQIARARAEIDAQITTHLTALDTHAAEQLPQAAQITTLHAKSATLPARREP